MTYPIIAAATLAGAAAGLAHATPLVVGEIDAQPRESVTYRCENAPESFRVSYWRARNGQSFALVPVRATPLLFVDTLAASGVRYQAGRYVWWTKGRDANLYDEMAGGGAPPMLAGCAEIPAGTKDR